MLLKRVDAKIVWNSRREKTILVEVNGCLTAAPSGKSKGRYEARPYQNGLEGDVRFLKNLKACIEIDKFEDLENVVGMNIGANSLFALEASILKALAKQEKKELWQLLNPNARKMPMPVGNAVGGGLHTRGVFHKPDFQEFLFLSSGGKFKDRVKKNLEAYKLVGKLLGAKERNDEGAWKTHLSNEAVLQLMRKVADKFKIDIGVDIASSSFFKDGIYHYKNYEEEREKKEQIEYLKGLIKKYKVKYVEDPLYEEGFAGWAELRKKIWKKALVVGDDLTTTNPERLKKAIKQKSINAIIVKPNQIGSLLKVKEVIDIAKKANVKTIISHRSGETIDNTIADLAVGWECDYIKTGIYGKEREAKLKRLVRIEKMIK